MSLYKLRVNEQALCRQGIVVCSAPTETQLKIKYKLTTKYPTNVARLCQLLEDSYKASLSQLYCRKFEQLFAGDKVSGETIFN